MLPNKILKTKSILRQPNEGKRANLNLDSEQVRRDTFRVGFENVVEEIELPRSSLQTTKTDRFLSPLGRAVSQSRRVSTAYSPSEGTNLLSQQYSQNTNTNIDSSTRTEKPNIHENPNNHPKPIYIHRQIYDAKQFNSSFSDLGLYAKLEKSHQKTFFHKITFICRRPWEFLQRKLPILRWAPVYFKSEDPKKPWWRKLLNEIVPGVMVGVMGVPEGISFSFLAGVSPSHGVYTSIFPPIWYLFFGTSQHAAIGTYAITTLLVGFCVKTWAPLVQEKHQFHSSGLEMDYNLTNFNDTESQNQGFFIKNRPLYNRLIIPDDGEITFSELHERGSHSDPHYEENLLIYEDRAAYAATLAMISGLMMVIFGTLRLGFLFAYFSDPLIAGLTLGGSLQILFSQIPEITGLHIQEHFGPFNIIFNFIDLIKTYCHLEKDEWVMTLFTTGIAVLSWFLLIA